MSMVEEHDKHTRGSGANETGQISQESIHNFDSEEEESARAATGRDCGQDMQGEALSAAQTRQEKCIPP